MGTLNLDAVLLRFASNARVIAAYFDGMTAEQAATRTRPERWSSHEVLHHLVYEEREDFKKRVEWTLFHNDEGWPPIDPAGWIDERRYPDEPLASTLAAFLTGREASLSWLGELATDGRLDLTAANVHPLAGSMTVADLIASWLAHDHLHLRQLVRNEYERGATLTGVAETPYAGDW